MANFTRQFFFWACALGALGFILGLTTITSQRLRLVSELAQGRDDLGSVLPHQPGIYTAVALDGYEWIRLSREMVRQGHWRLGWTDTDNAPKGREVHWNSGFAWWLVLLGRMDSGLTGKPFDLAIADMGVWANPILLMISIVGFGSAVRWRYGSVPGGVVMVLMATLPMFNEGFSAAYPDHHGIINLAGLGTWLGLLWAGLGWIAPPGGGPFPDTLRQARQGIAISAVFGAAGLWISAISQVIFFIGTGVAILVAAWFCVPEMRRRGFIYHPQLWRYWGEVGAVLSLLFWLIEYFPDRMGMRLEVNHPFYAAAWWGGGCALEQVGAWLESGRQSAFPWRKIRLPFFLMALVPAAMIVGGPACYALMDPFLFRLHGHIEEFLPLFFRFWHEHLDLGMIFGATPLLFLAAGAIVWRRKTVGPLRLLTGACLCTLIFLTLMQCYQTRWGLLAGVGWVVLGLVVVLSYEESLPGGLRGAVLRVVLLTLLLWAFGGPGLTVFQGSCAQMQVTTFNFETSEAIHLLHRDIAQTIRKEYPGKEPVILSSPNSSLLLGYFGDCRTLGTLYWENHEGLRTAAELYDMRDGQDMAGRLEKLGVTHLVFVTWENFIEPYYSLLHPRGTAEDFGTTLAQRLFFRKQLPLWVKPVPYPDSGMRKVLSYDVLILEVVPRQSAGEAALNLGIYLFTEGHLDQAEKKLLELPLTDPCQASAGVYLGLIRCCRGDGAAGMKRVLAELDRMPVSQRGKMEWQASQDLIRTGRAAEAALLLERAAGREPENAIYVVNYAWLLATLEHDRIFNPARALALATPFKTDGRVSQTPRFHCLLSAAEMGLGDKKTAIDEALLARRLAQDQNDTQGIGYCARLLGRLGVKN